jgi:hypothetical protein
MTSSTWIYQGRQEHGWFGNGTGPQADHSASHGGPLPSDDTIARNAADVVDTAVGAIPASCGKRRPYAIQLDGGARAQVMKLAPGWARQLRQVGGDVEAFCARSLPYNVRTDVGRAVAALTAAASKTDPTRHDIRTAAEQVANAIVKTDTYQWASALRDHAHLINSAYGMEPPAPPAPVTPAAKAEESPAAKAPEPPAAKAAESPAAKAPEPPTAQLPATTTLFDLNSLARPYRITQKDWDAMKAALAKRTDLNAAQKYVILSLHGWEGGMKDDGNGVIGGFLESTLEDLGDKTPTSADDVITCTLHYMDKNMKPARKNIADNITDPKAAAALVDTLFYQGSGDGAEIIQNAINDVRKAMGQPNIDVDRNVGSGTLAAYQALANDPKQQQALRDAVAARRIEWAGARMKANIDDASDKINKKAIARINAIIRSGELTGEKKIERIYDEIEKQEAAKTKKAESQKAEYDSDATRFNALR